MKVPGFTVKEWTERAISTLTAAKNPLHCIEDVGSDKAVVSVCKKKDRGEWVINIIQIMYNGKSVCTLRLQRCGTDFLVAARLHIEIESHNLTSCLWPSI